LVDIIFIKEVDKLIELYKEFCSYEVAKKIQILKKSRNIAMNTNSAYCKNAILSLFMLSLVIVNEKKCIGGDCFDCTKNFFKEFYFVKSVSSFKEVKKKS
jgi:hypothetical protein